MNLAPFLPLPLRSALLLAAALFAVSPAFGDDTREAHTVRDDFETGELSAWETYPYAQDPGFNPTLLTVSEPAYGGSRFALCQVFKPTGTDFPDDLNRLGLVKRTHLDLRDDSRFKAAVFITADRRPARLRLVLAGADGLAYTLALDKPAVNEWLTIDAPAADFTAEGPNGRRRAGAGVELQAMLVVADFGRVWPERSYQLQLDDVSISGERPRRFFSVEPKSTYLEYFDRTVLHRHFAPGEAISFRVATTPIVPSPLPPLQSVACELVDSSGQTRASAPLVATRNGDWLGDALYTVAEGDPTGPWSARLTGVTADGNTLQSTLSLIVQPRRLAAADHPRLFFDAQGLAALRDDANPVRRALLEKALASARGRMSAQVADFPQGREINTESVGGNRFSTEWTDFGRWRNALHSGYPAHDTALLYAFTGEPAAGDKSAELLTHLATLDGWNHPWFDARRVHMYYPMGYAAYHAAVSFDLAYDRLSPQQRQAIREGLIRNVIEPAYQCEVVNNGIPSDVTNHLGVSMSGALMATLALMGEDPANPDMEPYFSGFLAKLQAHIDAAYLADGAYAESFCYHHMDAESVSKGFAALERVAGVDLTNTTYFRNAYFYSIYTATPNGQHCPDMGDALAYWGPDSKNHFLWLAHRLRDPLALDRYRWLTSEAMEKPVGTDFFDAIWMPEALSETLPEAELAAHKAEALPLERAFPLKGNVILRSGWGAGDLLLNYHAGPHSNHYHLDQGSFLLRYGGEDLISEADYADYYYNLNFKSFYIQAIGHNTLLLNNHPESQTTADMANGVAALANYPTLSPLRHGPGYTAFESELASVYKDRLDSYQRAIVKLDADYLVLADRVQAGAPEGFNWLFHARGGRDTISGEMPELTIKRPHAQLRMHFAGVQGLKHTLVDYPDAPRAFINVATPGRATGATLLTVLIPSREDNQADRANWKVEPFEEAGRTGVRVHRGDAIDTITLAPQATESTPLLDSLTIQTEAP